MTEKKGKQKVNRFDAKERDLLNGWFAVNPKPNPKQCANYAGVINQRRKVDGLNAGMADLTLEGRQIKFWFDHKRRMAKHGTYRPLRPGVNGGKVPPPKAKKGAGGEAPPAGHPQASGSGLTHDSGQGLISGSELPEWFNTPQLLPLLAKMVYRTWTADEVIIHEGEASDDMYFLLKGKVNVSKGGEHLAALSEGAFFGEMASLGDGKRNATIQTVTPTHAFMLRGADVRDMIAASSKASNEVVGSALSRLEELLVKSNEVQGSSGSIEYMVAKPNQILIEEDEYTDDFYFLRSGEVGISKQGQTIATIQGGSFFGEMSAINPGPRTTSVTALMYCEIFKMPGLILRALLRADSTLQAGMGESLNKVAVARAKDSIAAMTGNPSEAAREDLALAGDRMRAGDRQQVFKLLQAAMIAQNLTITQAQAEEIARLTNTDDPGAVPVPNAPVPPPGPFDQ